MVKREPFRNFSIMKIIFTRTFANIETNCVEELKFEIDGTNE